MKILVELALAVGLGSGFAGAQSTEADISARLMGKPLQLRGFWMDDKLAFDAAGKPVGVATEGSFTESAFDAKKVSLVGDHLRIEGQRVGLEFDSNGEAKRIPLMKESLFHKNPEMIVIDIDGHGNPDFSHELDAIFAGSLAELAPLMRTYWQPYARKHFLHIAEPDAQPSTAVAKIGGPVRAPRVLESVDPSFSESARVVKLSGTTLIDLVVDAEGKPGHFAIERPLGMGLEEHAIAAILHYKFAPAMRDGVPVKVALKIESNFRIF